jgi:AcrR family transcriptional regulator
LVRPRESEREDIRSLVLEKSRDLFLEFGYGHISMRRIAREIGYSPGTIYLYFKNKAEILYELHNEGFRLMFREKMKLRQELMQKPEIFQDPLLRLEEGGKMYVRFALKYPGYYDVMFNMPEPQQFIEYLRKKKNSLDVDEDYSKRSFQFLRETILACQEAGYWPNEDPDTVTFSCWSMIHGIITLSARKQVDFIDADTLSLATSVLETMTHTVRRTKE